MSIGTLDREQPTEAVVATSRRLARTLRLARYAGTPLLLVVVSAALYLYVHAKTLTSSEKRTLNYGFLRMRTIEHIELTLITTALILLVAVPLGILLTRRFARVVVGPMLALANIGQAVPSLGLLILLYVAFSDSLAPRTLAVIAFLAYGILPVLRNTMVGLQRVDAALIESGRGMGMSAAAVLARIELPLAVPVILAGIRTALVISVGTVTLATFIGAGGLGAVIDSGISSNVPVVTTTGAVIVAILALFIDWVAGIAEDLLRPRGL